MKNRIDQWYEELNKRPSLTKVDAEELKIHLLDAMDSYKSRGLNDAEAFEVATFLLEENYNYEKEFSIANINNFLVRKVILVFTGIMIYFFLYFLMTASARLLFYNESFFNTPAQTFRSLMIYIFCFHLMVLFLTFSFYIWKKRLFLKLQQRQIKPIYIFILIVIVTALVFSDYQLQKTLTSVPRQYLTSSRYFSIFGYCIYSFSSIVSIFFILLLTKYFSSKARSLKGELSDADKTINSNPEELKSNHPQMFEEYSKRGLTEEESLALVQIFHKANSGNKITKITDQREPDTRLRLFLVSFSGVLIFLALHFLMHATGKLFLVFSHHFNNDPANNLGWFRWYIISFNLLLIFFTTSIYFRDKDLLSQLKKLKLKHFYFIFCLSVFFAIIDSLLLPMSRMPLHDIKLKIKYTELVQLANFIFSATISFCFLFIYNDYFQKNIKTPGNKS